MTNLVGSSADNTRGFAYHPACIPFRANRKVQYHYDKTLYRQRHKIENVFGRIKDWRRVATR
ncbi:MAG: hypothetical protein JJ970_08255 [Erythrobacter sp.]|nr:hypothetical protein [Erythrobacter sp.]